MHIHKAAYDRYRFSDQTTVSDESYISDFVGMPSNTVSQPGARLGIYKQMYDRVTPGYGALSAAGLLVNSPVTSRKATFSKLFQTGWGHEFVAQTAGNPWRGTSTWGIGTFIGDQLGLNFPTELIDTTEMFIGAISKAMAHVDQPVVQGLAFAGELQQTIDLLRHPFSALTKFFRRPLKKRRVYDKSSGRYRWSTSWIIDRDAAIGAVAGQALAFNFGVLPLLKDAEGIFEALVFKHPQVLRQTARGFERSSGMSSETHGYASAGFVEMPLVTRVEESVEVRAGILYAFKGESSAAALGVRLRDVPAAAWELMPWSFVLDWIANVGDVVAGLVALCSSDLLTQWVTVRRTQVLTRSITGSRTSDPWRQTINCLDSDGCIYETYTRTPMPPGRGMGFRIAPNLDRVPTVSTISLLLQQLTNRR
jgi:hypothetical protein